MLYACTSGPPAPDEDAGSYVNPSGHYSWQSHWMVTGTAASTGRTIAVRMLVGTDEPWLGIAAADVVS